MKRVLIWCLLTEKRLLKKISYVIVLLMVPVLTWGLQRSAGEEAGMVTVGLCTDAKPGSLSDEVIGRFMTEKSVIRFLRYDSEEEAIRGLKESKVDAVWSFPERLEDEIKKLAEKRRIRPVIRVIEREDDVALTFTREVLCSRVFPHFVYEAYVNYVKTHVGENLMTEEELRKIYDGILWKGLLLQPEGQDVPRIKEESYFMAPVRGILSIWLVLAGFAALLYHKMDERNGVYDMIPGRKRIFRSFGLQAVVLTGCGVVYLIACMILGVFTQPLREICLLALFLICVSAFCNVVGLLVPKVEGIGVLIPFAVLLMVLLCPVFLDLRRIGEVRAILPPYYYLRAIYDSKYVVSMAIYAVVSLTICLILNIPLGQSGRKR